MKEKEEKIEAIENKPKKRGRPKKEKTLNDYYSADKILAEGSTYNVIIGQRSNGKTFDCVSRALEEFIKEDNPSVYIRRYDESITPANIFKLCGVHIKDLEIMSDGEYNNFDYKKKTFYCTHVDQSTGKVDKRSEPFLYCVGLNSWEHKKGQDRGFVKYVIFDEFLTRDTYLNDEYAKFMNLLSSVIRDRLGTIIFMLGNTVNKFCPYFQKFNIDMKDIKQGYIYNFKYGETTLSLEYCREYGNTSKVNKAYFDFPEKSLDMIKKGYWEIDSYPHLYSHKRDYSRQIDYLYIHFGNVVLRWELLIDETNNVYSFISPSDFDRALESNKIFITNDSLTLLDNRMCFGEFPKNKLTDYLLKTWKIGKMFFATDDVGDVFENFMKMNVMSNGLNSF